MKIIKLEEDNYPKRLKDIKNPPKQLYVEGNEELLNKDSIAIVGARKYTEYGKKYTANIAKELSKNNICIVSGMAVGTDSIAHINSMNEIGKTIAVLGSGFEQIYPIENYYLYNKILELGGCVITEYSPETKPDKANFPKRNRIVSGISMGVLITEARYYSGTTITARYAKQQEKEIFCIPSCLGMPTGYVPNNLIKNGAQLVTCADDILDYYYFDNDTQQNDSKTLQEYKEIYNLIGQLPISVNEIAKIAKKPVAQVMEGLCMLELEGYIKNVAGNLYIRNEI